MAIAFVNRAQNTVSNGGGTSYTTPATSHTAGNLLIVRLTDNSGNTAAISDTAGNTWVQAPPNSEDINAQTNRIRTFYAANCLGHASNVITATLTSSGTFVALSVQQFSGLGTAPAIFTLGKTGTGNTVSTGAFSVAPLAECLLVGAIVVMGSSFTAGSGFTGTDFGGTYGIYFADEYQIDANAGAQAVACSGGFADWAVLGLAIVPSSGGSPGGGGGASSYAFIG